MSAVKARRGVLSAGALPAGPRDNHFLEAALIPEPIRNICKNVFNGYVLLS